MQVRSFCLRTHVWTTVGPRDGFIKAPLLLYIFLTCKNFINSVNLIALHYKYSPDWVDSTFFL